MDIELTERQERYVDAFFRFDGDVLLISKYMGMDSWDVSRLHKNKSIQQVISVRTNDLASDVSKPFEVSKSDRIKLLWNIAQRGSKDIYDREGNEVMANPGVSVSAIRAINEMVEGSLAPKVSDIQVTVEDNRTESEIRDSIAQLTQDYNRLVAIDAIPESDVTNSTKLPDIAEAEYAYSNE